MEYVICTLNKDLHITHITTPYGEALISLYNHPPFILARGDGKAMELYRSYGKTLVDSYCPFVLVKRTITNSMALLIAVY